MIGLPPSDPLYTPPPALDRSVCYDVSPEQTCCSKRVDKGTGILIDLEYYTAKRVFKGATNKVGIQAGQAGR